MRIESGRRPAAVASGAARGRADAAGGGFALADDAAAPPSGGPGGVRAAPGVDVLIALQAIEPRAERRRRALSRGRGLLGALDALRLGVLEGAVSPATLDALRRLSHEQREATEDGGLDAVLDALDLRVAVELAKLGAGGTAAAQTRATA